MWDGVKSTWGGRARGFGTVPVSLGVQEIVWGRGEFLAGKGVVVTVWVVRVWGVGKFGPPENYALLVLVFQTTPQMVINSPCLTEKKELASPGKMATGKDFSNPLMDVILNGDSPVPTRVVEGVLQPVAPITAEQSTDASVSVACPKLPASSLPNVDSLSNAIIYSFFASQSTSPQLDNEDLKQIDIDDLEEMDLRWQMAMLTMRARRSLQKTGGNLGDNGPTSMGFDMSKLECYNCHKKGHFSRECRSPKDPRRHGAAEPQRRIVPRRSLQTLLIWIFHHQAQLMIMRFQPSGGYHAIPPPYTGIFMPPKPNLVFNIAPTSIETDHLAFNVQLSPTKSVQDLSHITRPNAPIIKDWLFDFDIESEPKALQFVPSFAQSSEHVKSPRHIVQQIKTTILKMAQPTQRNYAHRGHHKQYATLTHSKPQKHLVLTAVLTQSKSVYNIAVRPVSAALPNITMTRPRHAHHVVTKFTSPIRRHITRSPSSQTCNSPPRVTAVQTPVGNPQQALKDKGVIDSRCSRHMTGNMSYLSKFKELNGGYVSFGGNPKGGKITGKGKIKTGKLDFDYVYFVKELKFNLFSVSQMCDKKNIILFIDTKCLVLSSDFKLPDESQVLLRNNEEDVAFDGKEHDFNATKPESVIILSSSSSAQSRKQDDKTKKEDKGKNMPKLEDITYSDDEDVVGAETNFNNLESSIPVSPIPTTRILKDHHVSQIIGDLSLTTQTRSMTRAVKDQGHTHEEGIDYKEVFAPVARIEAIRLFLAYASFMGFMVYQMDVKSVFLYGTIKEEVYVCQPPGFEDPDHPDKVYKVVKALYGLHQAPRAWYETLATYLLENDDIIFSATNKDLCRSFEKLMKDKFQMSSMGELTFFLGLWVKKKKDGIFISQDKYVAGILRKFRLTEGKLASTPIDTEKPLLKDPDGEDVDVHTYRSKIGSLIYLTSSRPDIMFAGCACAHFQVTQKALHLYAVKRIFRYLKGKPHLGLWYPKDSPFDLVAYSDSGYAGCKKQTVVATSSIEAEYVAVAISGVKSKFSAVSIKLDITLTSSDSPLLGVNTPRSGEDRLEIMELTVFLLPKFEWFEIRVNVVGLKVSAVRHKLLLFRLTNWYCSLSAVSHIKYALTINLNIYVSCIKQFWNTVLVKQTDDVTRLQALVDKRKVVIMEAAITDVLRLDDAEGVDFLPNEEIFAELARMGYEKPSLKLTFYKAFFSSQWKFLILTILHSMSAKRTSWNEFSSAIASTVICLSTGRRFKFSKYIFKSLVRNVDSNSKFYMYLRFIQLLIRNQLGDETPLFEGMLVVGVIEEEGAEEQVHHTPPQSPQPQPQPQPQAQPQATDFLMSLLQEALDACVALTKRVEHLEYDKLAQALEITKLKKRVKKLEKGNRVKVLKLKRLKKGRMIDDLDKDDVVALMDDKEEEKKEKEEDEPAEVHEVVDVVTTAKLITKPQVLAAATTTAVPVRVAAASTRRRKGVVIRDLEEESTTIIPADTKSKDKGKGIMVEEPKPLKKKQQVEMDEEYARKLHEELNKDIDWDVAIEHVKQKAKEDPVVQRYQVMKKRPQTEAQAQKNIIMYLKNVAGFREDMESLWSLVKEIFSTYKPNNFFDDFLLTTLGAMFERPDGQAQVWKNQRTVHGQAKVKSWKLLESCGVHIITFTTTQQILLVERRYPLSRFTLDQMLNAVRLRVEEQSEMSLELLRFGVDAAMDLEEKHQVFNAPGEEVSAVKQKLRKEAETSHDELEDVDHVPTPSSDPLPSGKDSSILNELMVLCTSLQEHVLDLQKAKVTQAKEIVALKKKVSKLNKWRKSRSRGLKRLKKFGSVRRVKSSMKKDGLGAPEDASKQGRMIKEIDQNAKIALNDETYGRINDDEMIGVDDLAREEVVVETTTGIKDSATPTTDVTKDEITMAQALAALKSVNPKVVVEEQEMSTIIPAAATIVTTVVPTLRAKGIVFHKQKQSQIPTVFSSKDKSKAKMVEPEVPLKKKEQMRIDEEYTRKLQAKEQEASRLSRA
nr:hypothetical protein [Tanacetum cinerariifolium]